jgi:Domain of unknown function (DUF4365)
MTDLPERPRAHEVADAAVNEFRHHAPSSWSANELSRDYGRDLLVSIPTPDGRMAGNDFWVQVKGSESVKYLEDRAHLSFDLEVRTINHLLSVGGPSMLAVCDVAKSDKPVFWAWIEEGIEAAHPKWREQKTLNIRVPLIQELSKTSKKIEDHVSAWHSNRQISGRISQFVSAAIGSKPDTNIPPEAYLREVAIPKLQTLGILETTATGETVSYTPDQVKLKRDLAEIGALLKVYDDRAASTALDDIVSRAEAEGVPARLQSVYFNHRGVLASRSGKIALSVEWHRRAVDHNPDEIIFLTNLLMSELALSDESDNAVILPQDWDARLACILQSRPDFIPAIKIMVRRLAETEGLERAKQYVGEFDKKELIIEANLSLAEACLFGGSPGSALDAVEKAETNGAKLDSFFHSLKAHILFIQSTKASGDLREVVLQGTGPADLDTTALIRSGEHYEKACALIVREGFPTNAAEQVVANAATAMILLGTPQRAIELCQGQIALNPASLLINSALAAAYAQANEPSKAVLHTRRGPDTSHTFQNLILLLAATDRLDELIEETSNRETLGFRNDDERGLCYELAAIALWSAERLNLQRSAWLN